MKQQDENLSLLLDGDRDADVDVVLDEVIADVNMQYRMRRYLMIGEVMRNELPAAIDSDFHGNVMDRIRKEAAAATYHRPPAKVAGTVIPLNARSWFRPFAGLAVAASVAIVTVALWQPLHQQGSEANTSLASADQQKIEQLAQRPVVVSAVPVSTRVQDSGTHWKMENGSPVLQQKLNAYLVNHTEYSNSMQGLIPQARVVGFDAQQ